MNIAFLRTSPSSDLRVNHLHFMPGRALAPEDLHPRQNGGGNHGMVYCGEVVETSFLPS